MIGIMIILLLTSSVIMAARPSSLLDDLDRPSAHLPPWPLDEHSVRPSDLHVNRHVRHVSVNEPRLNRIASKMARKLMSPKLDQYFSQEHRFEKQLGESTWMQLITDTLPIIDTLSNYTLSNLKADVGAGITVGIQLLPKGMAYAMMAGLSKSNGVIVAFMASVLYPICGSTPFLCLGPDPVICLLISNVVQTLNFAQDDFVKVHGDCATAAAIEQIRNNPDSVCAHNYTDWEAEKQSAMAIIAAWTAFFYVVANLFNFGIASNFISKPITDAFVCSAALVIMLKQFHYCLNMTKVAGQGTFFVNLYQFSMSVSEYISEFTVHHMVASVLSLITLIILFGLHFWAHSHKKGHQIAAQVPAVLLVVLLGIGFT